MKLGLAVLADFPNLPAYLIKEGLMPDERLQKLNKVAFYQMRLLAGEF